MQESCVVKIRQWRQRKTVFEQSVKSVNSPSQYPYIYPNMQKKNTKMVSHWCLFVGPCKPPPLLVSVDCKLHIQLRIQNKHTLHSTANNSSVSSNIITITRTTCNYNTCTVAKTTRKFYFVSMSMSDPITSRTFWVWKPAWYFSSPLPQPDLTCKWSLSPAFPIGMKGCSGSND